MIHLIREDIPEEEYKSGSENLMKRMMIIRKSQFPSTPITRSSFMTHLQLPKNSVIKLYSDGKLIPWSMFERRDPVEVRVCRPHQNVEPKFSDGQSPSEVMVRKKVQEFEARLASLEAVADPSLTSEKTDRDLQLLTKQISFLRNRLDEADQAEWVKNP